MRRMFSEKQLEELIKKVIADNNVDIVGKTLFQKEYNWESENAVLNSVWLNGLKANNSFVKVAQTNRCFYIIISSEIENDTAASITTNINTSLFGDITLPQEVAERIFRKDGSSLANAIISNDDIAPIEVSMFEYGGTGGTTRRALVYSSAAYKINVWLTSGLTFSVPANSKRTLDARIELLL